MKKKVIIIGLVIAVGIGFITLKAVTSMLGGSSMSYDSPSSGRMGSVGIEFANPMSASSALPSGSLSDLNPFSKSGSSEAGFGEDSNNGPASGEVKIEKKVIKTGRMTIKVDEANEAAGEINKIAQANNGEVFSTRFYQGANNTTSGNVTVKVPVDNFEKAFGEIKSVASLVMSESTSGEDVTEKYVDLQSQLKSKQAEEQAFQRILERAVQIDDVLKTTQQLSRVRGEVDVLQGKLRYLSSQTDMSTISIDLSEDPEITVTDSWRPWQLAKKTVNSMISDVQVFLNFVIVVVIRVLPVALLYVIFIFFVYWVIKKVYRKYQANKMKNIPQPPSPKM